MQATAFVGIGSNLGNRESNLGTAIELLSAEEGIEVVAVSEIRETEPVGPVEQAAFLNGALRLQTSLGPRELLERLLAVENRLGRERTERWGPRTIDLDLLLFGNEAIDEPGLTVPHPRLHERRFALEPLLDLDPALAIPGKGPVSTLLSELE
ncbi:MAG TPA: 2-amino-4-hydroxy-6-hydroxymethyldihydropteridine diphosphokinase [Gaiellaceae bacterium]